MSRKTKNPISFKIKKCKKKCHLIEGYVGLKRIKFGAEMGYKKCVVCECHFLFTKDSNNIIYCPCCNNRLRAKNPRRRAEVKERAEKFLMEITAV